MPANGFFSYFRETSRPGARRCKPSVFMRIAVTDYGVISPACRIDVEPVMKSFSLLRSVLATIAVVAMTCSPVFAAERITLRNGSEFDCVRQEAAGDHVRLYLFPATRAGAVNHTTADEANYIEVNASSVLRVEIVADPPALSSDALDGSPTSTTQLTAAEMRQMLDRAGALHNIDADLLASVVKAESNGNTLALSRAGAKGLMQLM